MAKSENNIVTHGLRGKVGDVLVFRSVDGKTIVSKVPVRNNREPSKKQLDQQEHFQEAVIYGKTVMVTPELKAIYETSVPDGKSVYRVAFADFLNAPEIKEINVEMYTGEVGSSIRIRATDDFKVKAVEVTIYGSDGSLIEKGEAASVANGMDWVYKATVPNKALSGSKIIVKASDIPGNSTNSDLNLS